jgi:hypothetical protein
MQKMKSIQRSFDFEDVFRFAKIRSCPNDRTHRVFGSCFSFGGRGWYCPDCGIEWKASLRTKHVKYYKIFKNGDVKQLKQVPLHRFYEYQRMLEKQSI